MRSRRRVVAVLALAACGCAREPTRLELKPLADGEWVVMDSSERGALVQLNHTDPPTVRLLTDRLTPVATDTFSLHAGESVITLLRIAGGVFYTSLAGSPKLQRSPTDPGLYAFEHDHAIWTFKTPDIVNKLTLDDGLDSLRARQREGEVILYWSVNPVWSAAGRSIAYLSNREAVRAGIGGQSIWMLDAYTGTQEPLYDVAGTSAHVDAVWGEDFVFSSNRAPGVWAVHPRTKAVRRIADGYVVAGDPRGRVLLLNHDGGLVVLRADQSRRLASPPHGQVWSTQADISPDAERVAVLSTDRAGSYSLHTIDADGKMTAPLLLPGPPSYGPAWTSNESLIITVSQRGHLQTYLARLR